MQRHCQRRNEVTGGSLDQALYDYIERVRSDTARVPCPKSNWLTSNDFDCHRVSRSTLVVPSPGLGRDNARVLHNGRSCDGGGFLSCIIRPSQIERGPITTGDGGDLSHVSRDAKDTRRARSEESGRRDGSRLVCQNHFPNNRWRRRRSGCACRASGHKSKCHKQYGYRKILVHGRASGEGIRGEAAMLSYEWVRQRHNSAEMQQAFPDVTPAFTFRKLLYSPRKASCRCRRHNCLPARQ
jgi:hypothetical protein